MRIVGNCSDISDLAQRVRGRLTEEQFGLGCDRLPPFMQVAQCYEGDGNIQLRQYVIEQTYSTTKDIT